MQNTSSELGVFHIIEEPSTGESLAGFLYHTAKLNFCESADLFSNVIEKKGISSSRITETAICLLGHMTNISQEKIRDLTVNDWGDQWGDGLANKVLLVGCTKFCPLCVQEGVRHKKIWLLRPVAVCLSHSVMLVDRCPGCNLLTTTWSLELMQCSCGFPWTSIESQSVDRESDVYKSQQQIFALVHGKTGVFNLGFAAYMRLAEASFNILSGLTSFLGSENAQITPFFTKSGGYRNDLMTVAMGNVYWMYKSRSHFRQVMDCFQKKSGRISYMQKASFEKIIDRTEFSVVREWYEAYFAQAYVETRVTKNHSVLKRNRALLEQLPVDSSEAVRTQLRLGPNGLRRLIQNGNVEAEVVRHGQVVRTRVNHDQLRKAKYLLESEYCTRRVAAQLLGVHVNSIRLLVGAGLLTPEVAPNGQLMMRRDGIVNLLTSLHPRIVSAAIGVCFQTAIVQYSTVPLPMAKLIELMQDGLLQPTAQIPNPRLCDLYFDTDELKSCVQLMRDAQKKVQGFSLADLRNELGVSERSILKMVDHGLLAPSRQEIRGQRTFVWFTFDAGQAFMQEYVLLHRAAGEFGHPMSRLYRWLDQGMLHNYTQGITKSALLKRSELRKLTDQMKRKEKVYNECASSHRE